VLVTALILGVGAVTAQTQGVTPNSALTPIPIQQLLQQQMLAQLQAINWQILQSQCYLPVAMTTMKIKKAMTTN
jgi:predicted Zn-dependent protease